MYQVSLNSSNYFQSIDLKYSKKELLKNKKIAKALVKKVNSRSTHGFRDKISDVDDGQLHRKIVQKHPNALNWSTDGAAAKNPLKCKTAFWPFTIVLNELPLSRRFIYFILAGIMILSHEPSPKLLNLIVQSFVDQ